MSVSVTVNNSNFTIPTTNDRGWGSQVTSWIQTVSSSTLQKSGGTFTLTADIDFGASFGLKAAYYKSRTSNPSSAGVFRLASTESIGWRNNANSGNVTLATNSSDTLIYDGPIFRVINATASAAVGVSINHTDNTSGTSNARLYLLSGGASGGDPYVRFSITSAQDWSLGADNSASDAFVLNTGSTIGANAAYLSVSTAGLVAIGEIGGSQDHVVNGTLRIGSSGGPQLAASSSNLVTSGPVYVGTTSGPLLQDSSGSLRVDGGIRTGGSVEASAIAEFSSTTKGMLPPRMTTTQRNAISSPAAGLLIYNTSTNKLNVYTTTWEVVSSS
jgi:hypothetical protein